MLDAVNRAKDNLIKKNGFGKNTNFIENLAEKIDKNKRIAIPNRDGLEFVAVSEIIHCEGLDGYTKIHLKEKKALLSSQSIGNFVKLLETYGFFYTHKSHLINLDYIKTYLNEGYIILLDGSKIPLSKLKKQEFLSFYKS